MDCEHARSCVGALQALIHGSYTVGGQGELTPVGLFPFHRQPFQALGA
jgi:hypothetical protein